MWGVITGTDYVATKRENQSDLYDGSFWSSCRCYCASQFMCKVAPKEHELREKEGKTEKEMRVKCSLCQYLMHRKCCAMIDCSTDMCVDVPADATCDATWNKDGVGLLVCKYCVRASNPNWRFFQFFSVPVVTFVILPMTSQQTSPDARVAHTCIMQNVGQKMRRKMGFVVCVMRCPFGPMMHIPTSSTRRYACMTRARCCANATILDMYASQVMMIAQVKGNGRV